MKVYIVLDCVEYEGSEILFVYKDKMEADKKVKELENVPKAGYYYDNYVCVEKEVL